MDILKPKARRVVLFFFDAFAGIISFYVACFLRFDGDIPPLYQELVIELIPIVFICRSASYYYFNFYNRFWKYSSLEDLIQIMKAVTTGTLLILFSLFILNRAEILPRSVLVIDVVLLIIILGGSRLGWRLWRERTMRAKDSLAENKVNVLIYGAGDMGAQLLRHLRRSGSRYFVCGYIDDDPYKVKKTLSEIKVLGNRHNIPEFVSEFGVKEILIADSSISTKVLEELIGICNKCEVNFKIASSVTDLRTNEIHIQKLKNIEIQDLLEREQISLDLSSIRNLVKGKCIVVTGAGGSIGSELCHQIAEYSPRSLVMIDKGENYLYELKSELDPKAKGANLHYVFCSVTNSQKLEKVFKEHRPQIVFHAAAHKHVPLMEDNLDEAIINNIYGTQVLSEVSHRFKVEKFVLVSTDKVVRPTSVMGMTKKVAEKYIQHKARDSQTQFMTVRFGNVLGSNGSVVPLFKKQIERGGPVTLTHPDMKRYFMLIPEAVQLILQAATIGEGREVFLLEMGEPVRILDLAKRMIQLAGYVPEKDVEIIFIGKRPGEKIVEELVCCNEKVVSTFHRKIKVLNLTEEITGDFEAQLKRMLELARNGCREEIKKELWRLGEGSGDAGHSPNTTVKSAIGVGQVRHDAPMR